MLTPAFVMAYSIQVAALAAAAGLTLGLFARWVPQVRLAAWRGVLAAAWLLPAATVWPAGNGVPAEVTGISFGMLAPAADAAGGAAAPALDAALLLTVVLVAGTLLRLAWIGAGAWRLTRDPGVSAAHGSPLFERLRGQLGVDAALVWHSSAIHPFTFGNGPATVVVPASLADATAATQTAVFTHELLHVARRDWRAMLIEELVAAPLWFHPAVWFARREIRQAREEIVDRATVARTRGRRAYAEMLLSFAERRPHVLAVSLPLFTGTQTPRRIAALLSEVTMSRSRLGFLSAVILFSSAAGLGATMRAVPLPAAGWFGEIGGQPLADEPGALERKAYVAPRDAQVPARLRYVAPVLPPSAAGMGEITVDLRVVLDESGRVVEARVVKAAGGAVEMPRHTEVFTAILGAVRQWQFARPAAAPLALSTRLTFEPIAGGTAQRYLARELPVPVNLISAVYPEADQAARIEGVAEVEITIDAAGRVSAAKLVNATTPAMGDAAIAALRGSTFVPGTKDGEPVPTTVTIAVRFSLK